MNLLIGLMIFAAGGILLLQIVIPVLSCSDVPWTDPVALFSYFIAFTFYVAKVQFTNCQLYYGSDFAADFYFVLQPGTPAS